MISIHAPRTGSDGHALANPQCGGEFQSTLPARGATFRAALGDGIIVFQSTLPARGATHSESIIVQPKTISIHAPRTGSDQDDFRRNVPCDISIHAPRTGSDTIFAIRQSAQKLFQSTLPARGATYLLHPMERFSNYFNPRSPHGERHTYIIPHLFAFVFQSTLPARGATAEDPAIAALAEFQSTLPARGATLGHGVAASVLGDFNPRSPHGERREQALYKAAAKDFNPRSPHGERPGMNAQHKTYIKFQSTLPARGATNMWQLAKVFLEAFQSTLPARGATP